MPNLKNQSQIVILQEKVKLAQSAAIIDYSGTTVSDMTKLRSEVKAAGGEVFVAKNTLIDLAFGKGNLTESLTGMNAVVFSYQDPVGAIKNLFKFHKDTNKVVIKQGFVTEGSKVLSVAEVKTLSDMPSKDQLIAKLMMILKSPATGMVNVLKGNQRNLVYALKAIAEKKAN